jgi:hypothetical protein
VTTDGYHCSTCNKTAGECQRIFIASITTNDPGREWCCDFCRDEGPKKAHVVKSPAEPEDAADTDTVRWVEGYWRSYVGELLRTTIHSVGVEKALAIMDDTAAYLAEQVRAEIAANPLHQLDVSEPSSYVDPAESDAPNPEAPNPQEHIPNHAQNPTRQEGREGRKDPDQDGTGQDGR